ncbi:hypothetical protein NEUTE1DRAFT_144484 [Neurospora tetrasperma FGSC 2508]|uniref:Proteasome assembly chaperone 3 n=1 Tax=Neurospora tetrasperma (strain FGSC 2508 / ATCC MYA-4615 / P0657) TaxID=510951 RepID=F8MC85_NEUT8|nr:uncharacterized protein NEUTE1DRAFT_144484 [Neurospora tetrasperma FGSC 2508]EGO61240.1 hypothetical protein NEUTE1DRAFT_144484 [Neurospora tetrasperma FGSC 2508]EGZ74755.1 hypothetical protein NEUTE2DRAFT_103768 [Neurospora tetrasperma FGSC 2509]
MDAPIQLSLPLPRSMDTRIYIQLTAKSKAVVLFLTTASAEEATSPTPLGSFVYALPDRYNPTQPLSTPLCTVEPTLEFTTRLAKLITRRTQLPTYVGNSVSFASAGLGGTVGEEMEAFKQVAELVLSKLESANATPNGVQS